jgi:hypothetical protein
VLGHTQDLQADWFNPPRLLPIQWLSPNVERKQKKEKKKKKKKLQLREKISEQSRKMTPDCELLSEARRAARSARV